MVFFLFAVFAFIHRNPAFADFNITCTEDPGQPTSLLPTPLGLPPCTKSNQPIVDENTRTVTITFNGLADNTDYGLIMGWNKADWESNNNNYEDAGISDGTGKLTLNFCPDGKETLKKAPDKGKGECDNGDYFWAQHTYRVGLYRKDDKSISNIIDDAQIYVMHYYPQILINHLPIPENISNIHPNPNDPLTVDIVGTRRPHDKGDRNNYDVELHNQNGKLDYTCRTVHEDRLKPIPWWDTTNDHNDIKDVTFGPREVGDYLIKINEQVDEKSRSCSAGFTYYSIDVHVGDGGGWIGPVIADPNESDIKNIEEIQKASLSPTSYPTPPCNRIDAKTGKCLSIPTGLGIDISVDPAGFIKSVFGIILSLAGGIALILIIVSGYKLMASQGNPEAVQGAREQLASAVVGLLFIIFSLVILQIIGVDILHIPGFR